MCTTDTLLSLASNLPHSEEYGSVEDERVSRVPYVYSLFKDDNAKFHYYLEGSTRSTQHVVSIKSYQRKKNGRNTSLALARRYDRKDK